MFLVSVVIPLYNKGPHISRTLDSVFAQTASDFQIIVVDDGSTDNGLDAVASYNDDRIRLIRQENKGVSAARNRGICEAKSDLIAFLDADDEWDADHLETLLRLRYKFPEAGAYTTAYVYVQPGGECVPARFKEIPQSPWEGIIPDYFRAAALGAPPVWTSAVAIPRKIFEEVGYFQLGESLGEDHDMWGRIALIHEIAFSWEGRAIYHRDAEARICLEQRIGKELPFLGTVADHFPEAEMPESLRIYVRRMRDMYLKLLIDSKQRKKALVYLFSKTSFRTDKIHFIRSLLKIALPGFLVSYIRKIRYFLHPQE